jgi:archaellin
MTFDPSMAIGFIALALVAAAAAIFVAICIGAVLSPRSDYEPVETRDEGEAA